MARISAAPGCRMYVLNLAVLAMAGYCALLLRQQARTLALCAQAAAGTGEGDSRRAQLQDSGALMHAGESLGRSVCSEEEQEKQAKNFLEYRPRAKAELGCGMLENLDPFLKKLWNPKEQLVTLVNVGANKGYNLLEWIQQWNLVDGKTSALWGQLLIQKYKPAKGEEWKLCGTCGNCVPPPTELREPAVAYGPNRGVHIYGLEPSITNFKLLVEMKEWTGYDKMALLFAAASNHSGMAMFPITPIGYTLGKLGETSASGGADVRVLSLDEFVDEYRIDHINYLKIDTEGHDPSVLNGAMKSFQSHRIELVEFEYHILGAWKSTNLEDVVRKFDSFGYDCFLALWKDATTLNKVVCLTGCWRPVYEFHSWSNVVCSSRRSMPLTKFLRAACTWR